MAVITDFGVVANGILQPKLKNRWRLEFTIGDQAFTVQAVTCERPKLQFDEVQLDRYNSRGYVAGKYTWQPIQVVYEDDVGGTLTQAIQNQLEIQENIIAVNPSPLLPASAAGQLYKFGVKLKMLDGNETVFEEWALEGAWLQNIDWGDLDYAASEAVKITATVRFDHARQNVTGTKYNMNNGPTPL
jgi:hypothetical protein